MKMVWWGLVGLLVGGLLWCGCAKKEPIPHLVLGTNAEIPPFVYRSEGGRDAGETVGLDIELALAIAEKVGRPLQVRNLPFEDLLPALASGQVEMVLAALPVTEARRKLVSFSMPYYRATPVAVIQAGGAVPEAAGELKALRLGALVGSLGFEEAEKLAGAGKVTAFVTLAEALQALRTRQVDCLLLDEERARRLAVRDPLLMLLGIPFEPELYAAAVPKGQTNLLAQINAVLEEVQRDGRFEQWLDKWLLPPREEE